MSVRHRRRGVRARVRLPRLPSGPPAPLLTVVERPAEQRRTPDGLLICSDCGHGFRWLVDDGLLCLRCDAILYPYDGWGRVAS